MIGTRSVRLTALPLTVITNIQPNRWSVSKCTGLTVVPVTVILFGILLLSAGPGHGQPSGRDAATTVDLSVDVRAAVERVLPLIEKAARGHIEQRTCFSCHHQALPIFAMVMARRAGFAVPESAIKEQVDFTYGVLARWAERTPERDTFGGGQADTAGYALFALEWGGKQPDNVTTAVVEYLLRRDAERGHWRNVSHRPPSEASPFTTTAMALRGLAVFAAQQHAEQVATRRQAARQWLLTTQPQDTEDRVFRLWGLYYAQADAVSLQRAAEDLLQQRHPAGGWGQTDAMEPDAYATGSALVALHLAAGLETHHTAYQQAVALLVRTQRGDGSWYVKSRSRPFQTYFETGFPHGEDQWISLAASSWAVAALALACGPEQREKRAP